MKLKNKIYDRDRNYTCCSEEYYCDLEREDYIDRATAAALELNRRDNEYWTEDGCFLIETKYKKILVELAEEYEVDEYDIEIRI
jgi:hypothetical protein